MRDLSDIFNLLCEYNLCSNQSDFSRDWLGRSNGYYAYLLSSGAEPNSASLGMLCARISNVLFQTVGKIDESDRKRLLKASVLAGIMMMRERSYEVSKRRVHRD
ncbi:DUF6626 family protein [Sphingobium rhizovicinum]|uniref:DUF6626 family protein n=1 Tax=Sphingobium rhizovicinum TaxID=432308 RepID=A0ABV7NIA3_9SPHN